MTKVLYRKYRPRLFSEIVGQEHIVQTLQNALAGDDVAHAYLFTGPRGTGKTTIARIFAKTLNCILPKGKNEACLKCALCQEFENGSSMDLIEIDAASNRGIDEIRQLKEGVRFAPTVGRYKIYLIDEVHMLTKEAFNALLKTLEEPPEHVIFMLATTELHKVLPTIISRCQRFDFRYLTHDEITSRLKGLLKSEKKSLDTEAIRLIVASSGGSLRDAESILGKVLSVGSSAAEDIRKLLGLTEIKKVASFVELISSSDKEGAIGSIDAIVKEGSDLEQFASGVIDYTRSLLLMKLSPRAGDIATTNFTREERDEARKQADGLTEKKIYNIIKEFIEVSNTIKYSPIPQLPLELAVVKLIDSQD